LDARVLPVKLKGLHVLPRLNKSNADEVLEYGNGRCRERYWRIEGKVMQKGLLEEGEGEGDQLFQMFRTWLCYRDSVHPQIWDVERNEAHGKNTRQALFSPGVF